VERFSKRRSHGRHSLTGIIFGIGRHMAATKKRLMIVGQLQDPAFQRGYQLPDGCVRCNNSAPHSEWIMMRRCR
jgi:hypothetical protein